MQFDYHKYDQKRGPSLLADAALSVGSATEGGRGRGRGRGTKGRPSLEAGSQAARSARVRPVGLLKNLIGFRTLLEDDENGSYAQMWADNTLCFSAATTSFLRTTEELEATVDRISFFAASDGKNSVIIEGPDDLAAFIAQHRDCMFVCHDAAVDFHLVKRYLERNDEHNALEWWWEVTNRNRLRDTGFLDSLIRLGREDIWPVPRDFNVLMQDYLPKEVVNEEILRPSRPRGLRFYPPVNNDQVEVDVEEEIDAMFMDAVRDVRLMALAYPEMHGLAVKLMIPHRSEILNNALMDYGPLSEGIQVKASIVLGDVTRNGMAVDIEGARDLRRHYEKILYDATAELVANPEFSGLFHQDRKMAKFLETVKSGGVDDKQAIGDALISARRSQATGPQGYEYDNGVEKGSLFSKEFLSHWDRPSVVQEKLTEILLQAKQDIKTLYDVSVKVKKTTITNKFSTSSKMWLQYVDFHPFIRSWVDMDRASRHLAFLQHLQKPIAHPEYTVMVRNGRSTCGSPSIQQTPRKGGFRELFMASEGRVILAVDYAYIELCTLASVCEARYGQSNLADIIRQGVDPHCFTASMFEGVPLEEFMSWKESPDVEVRSKFTALRQRAKAINFGIPGGLSAGGLMEYAKTGYNVDMNYAEAVMFRKRLTKEVYPELNKYLREREISVVAHNLQCKNVDECITALALRGSRSMSNAIKNLVRGRILKMAKKHQKSDWQKKVWEGIKAVCRNPEILRLINEGNCTGSEKLFTSIYGSSVATLTGRVRGYVTFTQACNTPFSGLAADGAKLAMWNLYMVGYRIVAFIHDEILIELNDHADWTAEAQMVERIVCESMQELNGTIPIGCSYALSRRWSKDAEATYDEQGRLIVWEPES